ncbi:ROK family protein [Paenibacillus allorhizosphaerae]|uniref:Glucokinase n=1 Tax=Paenibacillus allorhizosphaerae TaxID=2849866 RepID=A0ABM8VAD7_9BACL|nr:ROK family protein [Paenibacillus allorhizosphaerae]CAG7616204.1 Glucokinase [Paenibacillus allorhizosphaerae]
MEIAIDFGGTNIKLGLIDGGQARDLATLPAYSGQGLLKRLPAVEQAVLDMLKRHEISLDQCRGIGLAIPGIVDFAAGQLLSVNKKYADAIGFHFAGWAADTFCLRSVLENDARAALIGEVAHGAAQGERDVVLVSFGTGIGTSAMIDGKVLRGKHHLAGILGGHFVTGDMGVLCNCGNAGCLEAQASHWALPRLFRSHLHHSSSVLKEHEDLSYLTLLQAADAGDRVASELAEQLILQWGAGLVNMVHAYDPELVVLSGGLMKSASRVLPQLAAYVHKHAWAPWGKVRITAAARPELSVLLGVSHLLG